MDVNPPHPPLQGTKSATIESNASSIPSQLPRKRLAISTDMGMGEDGKPRSRETFTIRQKLVMEIIENGRPYSFCEYEGVIERFKYLNPDVDFVSRNTIVGDMRAVYMSKMESLKEELANIPSRICLTYNVWTACTTEDYICLTAHYVDSTFTLCNKILGFSEMPLPLSEYETSRKVIDVLKDWGIEKRIFSITLDNASGNIGMQDMLKEQLCIQNNLLCNGEFFHVPCFANILNLIVQEGLEVINDVLLKIRQSVVHVKWLEEKMKKFEECVKNLQIEGGVHLHVDEPSRWNSSFTMLESALKYKSAFSSFQEEDENYTYCPSSLEWERGEKMLEFLRPFNDVTNSISCSTPSTSNLYFTELWCIECELIQNSNNEDDTIRDMAIRMKMKFDEYWDKHSVVFALGAVLDPEFKFTSLEYCYDNVDPTTWQLKLEVVRRKLFQLYDAYVSAASSSSSQTKSPIMDLQDIENQIAVSATAGKSQLELYLDEPKLDNCSSEDHVLQYWEANRTRFPDLSLMAIDILSIPMTTVGLKSVFNIGFQSLYRYRNCRLSEEERVLICSRNWLIGFKREGEHAPHSLVTDDYEDEDDEDDEDEDDKDEDDEDEDYEDDEDEDDEDDEDYEDDEDEDDEDD